MTDEQAGTGEQSLERGAAEENADSPVTQTEIDASRRAPSAPGTSDESEAAGGSDAPGGPDAS